MEYSNQADEFRFTVPASMSRETLRVFLRDCLPLEPTEYLRFLTQNGNVLVNGARAGRKRVLQEGDEVEVRGVVSERKGFETVSLAPEVIYEDPHILVLNKPAGCTVVLRRGSEHCEFQNGILDYLRQDPAAFDAAMRARYRPRALHRLDQNTTGAIIEAKDRPGELHVFNQIQNHTVTKEYLAVVVGEMADDRGTIEEPIAPVPGDLSRMQIHRDGKPSRTDYEVVERFRGYTLVRLLLHTGRRHQIRLHMAWLGRPVAADALYGGGEGFFLSRLKRGYVTGRGREERPLIARQALHALAIAFCPVGADRPVRVEAPLPKDMAVLLKQLRKYG